MRTTRADNARLTAAIITARAAHTAKPTPAKKRALDAAVNAACAANMGLVAVIATKFIPKARSYAFEDLVNEGAIGLHRALQTFDPSIGYALSTYASWWIKQTIRRAIDVNDMTIRVPVGLLETKRMQGPVCNGIRAQFGREATVEEVLAAARTTKEAARTAFALDTGPVASLDRAVFEGGPSLIEGIEGNEEDPEDAAIRTRRERQLRDLLATLTPRERIIMEGRMAERTLGDVGAQLGVTRERIRQIEAKAFKKLRRVAKLRGAAQ